MVRRHWLSRILCSLKSTAASHGQKNHVLVSLLQLGDLGAANSIRRSETPHLLLAIGLSLPRTNTAHCLWPARFKQMSSPSLSGDTTAFRPLLIHPYPSKSLPASSVLCPWHMLLSWHDQLLLIIVSFWKFLPWLSLLWLSCHQSLGMSSILYFSFETKV